MSQSAISVEFVHDGIKIKFFSMFRNLVVIETHCHIRSAWGSRSSDCIPNSKFAVSGVYICYLSALFVSQVLSYKIINVLGIFLYCKILAIFVTN